MTIKPVSLFPAVFCMGSTLFRECSKEADLNGTVEPLCICPPYYSEGLLCTNDLPTEP